MKKHLLRYFCILLTPLSLVACNKGEEITDYYNNHESHWAYNKDCNKVNEGAHKFNNEHKCTVCGYEDPILLINDDGILTGLTEHGKTLENITLTDKVHFIDNNAFEGSKVKKIHLSNSIFGMGVKAYDYLSTLNNIKTNYKLSNKEVKIINKELGKLKRAIKYYKEKTV